MERALLLTIAGFDPSANAGFLADVKTFEAHKIDSLAVSTANTIQTDSKFLSADFFSLNEIKAQLIPLIETYKIDGVKIGIIKNLEVLSKLITFLRENLKDLPIILDPIFKTSSGFKIHENFNCKLLVNLLKNVNLVTPNISEFKKCESSIWFNTNCYIKSYIETDSKVTDYAKIDNKDYYFEFKKIKNHEKHGSGCVFSASVLAHFVKSKDLLSSVTKAGQYLNQYLASSDTLRGVHCYE